MEKINIRTEKNEIRKQTNKQIYNREDKQCKNIYQNRQ